MLFNSYLFIFIFLPFTLLGWYGLNHYKRYELAKVFLAGMSLWFYGYFNVYYLAIIITSILFNYFLSWLLTFAQANYARTKLLNRIGLFAGLIFNLGLLFYFKYYDSCFSRGFYVETYSAASRHQLFYLSTALLYHRPLSFKG